MALFGRLGSYQLRGIQHCRSPIRPIPKRTLTFTSIRTSSILYDSREPRSLLPGSKRSFASSSRRSLTGQEAPSAQAYISSGILGEKNKNLVDVKKVLVIGSGGLSIGQAGEFDYSGKSNGSHLLVAANPPQVETRVIWT